MVDYKTEAHNIYLTTHIMPMPKLRILGTVNMNMATAALDEVVMPDVSDRVVTLDGGTDLTHSDLGFEDMHDYSNLDYTLMRFALGLEYSLTSTTTFTVDGEYADLTDDEGYVYGVESGSYYVIRTGFRVNF